MRAVAAATALALTVTVGACGEATFTPLPRGVLPFSAPDLVNPLRGQFENLQTTLFPQANSADRAYPAWPGTADENNRFTWQSLQPKNPSSVPAGARDDQRYDFRALDAAIADAAAQGHRFGFRVTAFDSCCAATKPGATVSSVPDWLRSVPGATHTYDHAGVHYVIPNWNSNAYLSRFTALLAALGRRYDHDERVAVFEMSGYGDFSENHVTFMRDTLGLPAPTPAQSVATLGYFSQYRDQYIDKAAADRLVDANLRAFPDTRIVAAMGNPEIAKRLLRDSPVLKRVRHPVGMRSDSLGTYPVIPTWAENQYSQYVQRRDPIVSILTERYRTAPIMTEWPPQLLLGGTELQYYQTGLQDVVNYHVSMTASTGFPAQTSSTPMSAQIYDLWSRANKYAGYRYAATGVALSGSDLAVTWTNFGSAPTYEDWHVQYQIVDQQGHVRRTVPGGIRLGTLAADQHFTDLSGAPAAASAVDHVDVSGLAPGTYYVRVRVDWAEHKPRATHIVDLPPMQLAMQGRYGDGGYDAGTITVE
ncbi:fibronectin type III domain-containing protein [Tsukamurella soli]|uniref:hypothetical protein n=1 Tax=Tsukamurella soli TaxID=644556 RepID=UPI0031E61910